MGAWRYCQKCGGGQSRITIEEIAIALNAWEPSIRCSHCQAPRADDDEDERMLVLVDAIVELRKGRQQ